MPHLGHGAAPDAAPEGRDERQHRLLPCPPSLSGLRPRRHQQVERLIAATPPKEKDGDAGWPASASLPVPNRARSTGSLRAGNGPPERGRVRGCPVARVRRRGRCPALARIGHPAHCSNGLGGKAGRAAPVAVEHDRDPMSPLTKRRYMRLCATTPRPRQRPETQLPPRPAAQILGRLAHAVAVAAGIDSHITGGFPADRPDAVPSRCAMTWGCSTGRRLQGCLAGSGASAGPNSPRDYAAPEAKEPGRARPVPARASRGGRGLEETADRQGFRRCDV